MKRSIEQGFSDFLNKIKATKVENDAAKSHRASIKTCLQDNLGLQRFTRIGSFGNETNVSGYSDVDYLACFPNYRLTKTSNASLVKVKNVLESRFPNTGVTVKCPTVVCPFGKYKSETTEIVVAYYIKEESGNKVYKIADCHDAWMEISPDAHNAYVTDVDANLNRMVKPLIRLIKAWKFYNNVSISSFYLEIMVAKYASKQNKIDYEMDIRFILQDLLINNLKKMQDPTAVSGYICPCKTESLKADALSKIKIAITLTDEAYQAALSNDIKRAFELWGQIYKKKFPSY